MRTIKPFYTVFFLFIITSPVFSYIDPATGSMLFSAAIGIVASGYFLFKQLLMKLKFFSFSKNKEKAPKESIVIYGEGKQYWNVFKPVIDELVKQKEPCTYLTADKEDPGLNYKSDLVKTQFIGEGNKAFIKLNMLEADICLTTTPGLDVLQFKRSKRVKHYSHIFHATDNTATYRLFSLDYYDSVLMNGDHQGAILRELEETRGTQKKELDIVGCTYLDELNKKKASLPPRENKEFTILVSPSWGPNGLFKKYGLDLLLPLAEKGINLILRPHPQSSHVEKEMLESLKEGLKEFKNVKWDFEKDNIIAMNQADMMISDFSSVMYDFIFLFEKPVITFNFSLDPRGFELSQIKKEDPFYMVKQSGAIINLELENLKDLPERVLSYKEDSQLKDKIKNLSHHAWMHKGEGGKRTAQFLIETKRKLQ